MDVSPELFRQWEAQKIASERSRMMAKEATERRVRAAKARVEAALQVLERAARMEANAMR